MTEKSKPAAGEIAGGRGRYGQLETGYLTSLVRYL